jgi:hypothetical protein
MRCCFSALRAVFLMVNSPAHDTTSGFGGVPLDDTTSVTKAIPIQGGDSREICDPSCPVAWAPNGKFFYVGVERDSRTSAGQTLAIPVPPGETLPTLPAAGIRHIEDARALPGARIVDGYRIAPGADPSVFA